MNPQLPANAKMGMVHATSIVLFVVAASCLQRTDAFLPNKLTEFLLNILDKSSASSTHKDLTEQAILQVTAELLKDNPHPGVDSTQRINELPELTASNLLNAYYGSGTSTSDLRRQYEEAIEQISEANEEVDLGDEEKLAEAHFDSEQFQAGQNRLISLRGSVVAEIQNGAYESARRFAGRMLHTLQDFYSHSNWIEMGRRSPYSVLGQPGQQPVNIASPTMQTCTDCEVKGEVGTITSVGAELAIGQKAEYLYECNDNILNEVNENGILTSGYYTGQLNTDRQPINKCTMQVMTDNLSGESPETVEVCHLKCSHGGFGDPSSDLPAKGGINKDSKSTKWSPHADLHEDAAAVAVQASVNLLEDIRAQIDDDIKFAAFLNIELTRQVVTSIAYVIDTTGSMYDELPEIQSTLPEIRVFLENYVRELGGNAVVQLILVPFNDPGKVHV